MPRTVYRVPCTGTRCAVRGTRYEDFTSSFCPLASLTMAFFKSVVFPQRAPRRRGLPCRSWVLTWRTRTLKSCSTASRISILFASKATARSYWSCAAIRVPFSLCSTRRTTVVAGRIPLDLYPGAGHGYLNRRSESPQRAYAPMRSNGMHRLSLPHRRGALRGRRLGGAGLRSGDRRTLRRLRGCCRSEARFESCKGTLCHQHLIRVEHIIRIETCGLP